MILCKTSRHPIHESPRVAAVSLQPAAVRDRDAMAIACAFGLSTGIAEVSISCFKKFYLGTYLHLGPMFIWTTPLVYVCLFSLTGICWPVLGRRLPRIFSLRSLLLACTFLSVWTVLLQTGKIGPIGRFFLSLGVAVRFSSFVASRPSLASVFVRWTLGWLGPFLQRKHRQINAATEQPAYTIALPSRRAVLASSCATAAALVAGAYAWDRRLAWRNRSTATPPPGAPNILFLSLDTVRAQSLSAYGYDRPTSPNLDQLAKIGIRFDHAIATAGWTLPSHAAMFTGRSPKELRCNFTVPLDDTFPTLAEVLANVGYETAGFAANSFFCSRESGLNRGFGHFEDCDAAFNRVIVSTKLGEATRHPLERALHVTFDEPGRKNAARLSSDFERWLAARDPSRPFFAFLNYFDAHDPYFPPAEFLCTPSVESPIRGIGHHQAYSPEGVRELNDAYDGSIRFLDHHVGGLLQRLEERRILDNTLVVVVGDHGEQFGEHGLLQHANSLYMQLLKVPLILYHKSRLPGGRAITTPMSLRDLPSTILAFVSPSLTPELPGRSLSRYWDARGRDPGGDSETVLSWVRDGYGNTVDGNGNSMGPTTSLVRGGLHYIREDGRAEELYDYLTDPQENINLADTDNGRWQLERFREIERGLQAHT